MRELKRSIARAHMRDIGAKQINRLTKDFPTRSAFAWYWKWFLVFDPIDEKKNKKNKALLDSIDASIKKRRALVENLT